MFITRHPFASILGCLAYALGVKAWNQSSYDFVIVGGGTAGLVLANRLSEVSNQTVLVLEDGTSPTVVKQYSIPGDDEQVLGTQINWGFGTSPQVALDNRILAYPRGRCLGGSSAINGLTYMRGSSSLYDDWAALGNPGWSWDDVLPYFKKSTRFVASSNNSRFAGYDPAAYSDGPVPVAYADYVPTSVDPWIEGLIEIGIPYNPELNLGNSRGVKRELYSSDGSKRASSYDAYYVPVQNRKNLVAITDAQVDQIILEGTGNNVQATGVVYLDKTSGETKNITATKEVILSAGVFKSPQLLMLSGIGPTAELQKQGITVMVANDNIGQHLTDHPEFSLTARIQANFSESPLYNDVAKLQAAEAEYRDTGRGPLSTAPSPAFAFESLNATELQSLGATTLLNRTNQSHVEYFYQPLYFPAIPKPNGVAKMKNESYLSTIAVLIAPDSQGNVTLYSSSSGDAPVINPGWLTSPQDVRIQVRNFRRLRQLLATPSISKLTIGPDNGEVAPGASVQSDEDIVSYIRAVSWNVYHASGTCQMRPKDDGGVVDSHLRVYGVKCLRVVDTSVFPIIPDAHTQGPVYMVAEKAADLIKAEWGL